jgi:hypothetical protein
MLVGLSYFAAIFNLRTPSARDCAPARNADEPTPSRDELARIANQAARNADQHTRIAGGLAPSANRPGRNTGEAARNGDEPALIAVRPARSRR